MIHCMEEGAQASWSLGTPAGHFQGDVGEEVGTTCDKREGNGRRASLGFVLKGWVWTDHAFRLEQGKWKRRKPEGA